MFEISLEVGWDDSSSSTSARAVQKDSSAAQIDNEGATERDAATAEFTF